MKEYNIGDRIVLEIYKRESSCTGCFFLEANDKRGVCPSEIHKTCEAVLRKDEQDIIYKQINPSVQREENNCDFILGVKVAENKILKSLWHSPDEEIKVADDTFVIIQLTKDNAVEFVLWRSDTAHTYQIDLRDNMFRWCYLNDILPKNKTI